MVPPRTSLRFLILYLILSPVRLWALGQPQYVKTTPAPASFPLAHNGTAARLNVDPDDWPGVVRAAHDLQSDIHRVTGLDVSWSDDAKPTRGDVVLIGTIGKSRLIDRLIRTRKIDASQIQSKWESTLTQVVDHPLPGVARALVIAGSDKRGTIYGIYDLSENIGVSPWYWWADVPVAHQDALYVEAGRWIQGPPAVKYRGIFFNDEAPCAHRLGQRKVWRLQPPLLYKGIRTVASPARQFSVAGNVEQLLCRRRSAESETRR